MKMVLGDTLMFQIGKLRPQKGQALATVTWNPATSPQTFLTMSAEETEPRPGTNHAPSQPSLSPGSAPPGTGSPTPHVRAWQAAGLHGCLRAWAGAVTRQLHVPRPGHARLSAASVPPCPPAPACPLPLVLTGASLQPRSPAGVASHGASSPPQASLPEPL